MSMSLSFPSTDKIMNIYVVTRVAITSVVKYQVVILQRKDKFAQCLLVWTTKLKCISNW